jgi:hypothetical protein
MREQPRSFAASLRLPFARASAAATRSHSVSRFRSSLAKSARM